MKALIISIFCIIAGSTIANAQLSGQARIDSLLKELPRMKQDTNAVNLLKNLSIEYLPINPDEGIKYGEQGLQLANDINWLEGKAKCNGAIGMNYSFGKSDYSNALEFFRESLKIYTEVGNLEMMIYTLQNIGDIFETQSKYEEARKYYTQGLELIKNDEFIIYKANLLKRIAFTYRAQGDFMNALEHHYKALKIYEAEGDTIYFAGELHNIANNYIVQSNYPRALDYLHQALKINEEIGNFRWKANNLLAISLVYGHISEHEKALEYNQQALKLFEEMDNQFAIAAVLHNIGANYSDISEYEKAKDYYLRAMKMNEEMGNLQWLSNNLASLGNIYLHYLDYSKALEYYERALSISEEIGDKSGIAANLGSIGSFYLSLSQDSIINKNEKKVQMLINKDINLTKSINYLQRALALQIETGELKSQFSTLFHLSNAYELKGDYKKAFEAYKEYKTLQDSVFSMDRQKELANLDAKRENELKDAEIVILQTQKKAQQFQSYLLAGGVIVLFGAFGIAFLRFREKKKLSDKLAIQNAEIENQKSIVEEKNEQIVASITYASTIQHAILPWESTLKNAFSDILIFYKPKDIVSGDSYWFKEVEGVKFLAAIDCTGHGIPGAMLTVIASSVLDDAVLGKRLSDTAEILTYMNDKVTDVLNQRLAENQTRDGMEVALIAIHQDKIQFTGAGRPLYIKNGTMEIIKTDKRGIAGSAKNDEYNFTSIEIDKAKNMTLFLTSDGFADQMNEHSKKYSTKRLISLLETISDKPISEQNTILEQEFINHRSSREQIDDVTILGVKI